jgi:hypothetical protein
MRMVHSLDTLAAANYVPGNSYRSMPWKSRASVLSRSLKCGDLSGPAMQGLWSCARPPPCRQLGAAAAAPPTCLVRTPRRCVRSTGLKLAVS